MNETELAKGLFTGQPVLKTFRQLEDTGAVQFAIWLAHQRRALGDKASILLPATGPDDSASLSIIDKLNEARQHLSGEVFDMAWQAVSFTMDLTEAEAVSFRPQLLHNGALVFRKGQESMSMDRDAVAALSCSSDALRRELVSLEKLLPKTSPEQGLSYVSRYGDTVTWSMKAPTAFSTIGESLIVLGSLAVDAIPRLKKGDLLRAVEQLQKSMAASEGPLVLRTFGDRTMVHILHSSPDKYVRLADQFGSPLILDEATSAAVQCRPMNGMRLLKSRVSTAVAEMEPELLQLRHVSKVIELLVRNEILEVYPAIKARELSETEPVFSTSGVQPAGHLRNFAPFWPLAQGLKQNLCVFEVDYAALARKGTTPAGILKELVRVLPAAGDASNWLYIPDNPEDMDIDSLDDLLAPASKPARDRLSALAKDIKGQWDGYGANRPSLEDFTKKLELSIFVVTPQADLTPEAAHDAAQALSSVVDGPVSVHVPLYGMSQQFSEGYRTEGNAAWIVPD